MHISNLFYNAPNVALGGAAVRALVRRGRVLLQLGRRGQRGRDQARAQGAPARRHGRRPQRRSTGARTARFERDAAGGQAGAVRAAGARLPAPCRRARSPACGRREHRRGADRARPGRVGREPDATRAAGRDPRGLRRGRRRAGVRRGPDRHGADRLAVGLRADRRRPGRDDAGQGPGRRAADRRARHRRAAAGRLRAGRPRLDVRRRAGGVVGGAGRARRDRRRGVPGAACASRASGCWRACANFLACSPRAGAG